MGTLIPKTVEATIASGAATSEAIGKAGYARVGVILPAELEGTTLTLTVSRTKTGTYYPLKDTSGAISLTVANTGAYLLSASLAPFPWFKIVMGSNQTTTDTELVVFLED